MDEMKPVVTLIQEGTPETIKNRYGESRTVTVDRVWKVELDGKDIGRIRYRMITRERKGAGMRYVYSRWQSPGWEYGYADGRYWIEGSSKKRCIESLLWDARVSA